MQKDRYLLKYRKLLRKMSQMPRIVQRNITFVYIFLHFLHFSYACFSLFCILLIVENLVLNFLHPIVV